MNKKEFLDFFSGYDKNHMSKLYEDIELAKRIQCPIVTEEFVTPDVYMKLMKMEQAIGIRVEAYGVFNECERKKVCFGGDGNVEEFDFYGITLLKVTNKSKFKNLCHRDYLGSLMGLGVKRELFGDLVVREESCFIPASSKVSGYIIDNLKMIGRCPCSIEAVDLNASDIPQVSFEEKTVLSSSMRIDNIIPAICGLTRSRGNDLISSSSVMVNYLECRQKDFKVCIGDTVTVRGYGKYKIISSLGETAKGRCKIVIGKYI